MGEDFESEWHSSVSPASDSRCGELVLNIKATQQRTWANGPYWYGTSQVGTHTETHRDAHTTAHVQAHRHWKGSVPARWQSKAERTRMFNSQPSISACSCSYYAPWPPQPPRSIPHKPRCRNWRRRDEQGWRRNSEHIWGWDKANNISRSGPSVMEVQHSKLIRFPSRA